MVIVIGGDGTVRQVARELAGTDTRISIVALGSGNVLAYNLGLANHDLATKISIALTGPSVELDVGWANLQTASGQRFDEPFLTLAGIGRDAQPSRAPGCRPRCGSAPPPTPCTGYGRRSGRRCR